MVRKQQSKDTEHGVLAARSVATLESEIARLKVQLQEKRERNKVFLSLAREMQQTLLPILVAVAGVCMLLCITMYYPLPLLLTCTSISLFTISCKPHLSSKAFLSLFVALTIGFDQR